MRRDLISRQEAIEAAQNIIDTYEARMPEWSGNDMLASGRDTATKYGHIADGAEKVQKAIENLPTAEPKKGRWRTLYERLEDGSHADYPDGISCSCCGWMNICGWRNINAKKYKFCPNCGADMIGGENV